MMMIHDNNDDYDDGNYDKNYSGDNEDDGNYDKNCSGDNENDDLSEYKIMMI